MCQLMSTATSRSVAGLDGATEAPAAKRALEGLLGARPVAWFVGIEAVVGRAE